MCPICEGTGQCPWCAGVGTLPPAENSDSTARTPCLHCAQPGDLATDRPGNGKCPTCQGTGV